MKAKRMITKKENAYWFSYQKFVSELPAGTYFPGDDINGTFKLMMARSDGSDKLSDDAFTKEVMVLLREHEEASRKKHAELIKQQSGKVSAEDTTGATNGHGFNPATSNVPLRYMDQHYFPMEYYVKPFRELHSNIYTFLNAREFYLSKRLDYKRAVLMYGDHGVGKTRFLANLSDQLIAERNAIVIRIETRKHLECFIAGIPAISDFCRGRLKVVVIEELAELMRSTKVDSEILNTLDSTLLKDDILFLITTNYPKQIPDNIIDRPSRIDDTVGVFDHDFDAEFIQAWYTHLTGETIPEADIMSGFLDKVEGKLSPVYLKELFLRAHTREQSLEDTYNELVERRAELRKTDTRSDLPGIF